MFSSLPKGVRIAFNIVLALMAIGALGFMVSRSSLLSGPEAEVVEEVTTEEVEVAEVPVPVEVEVTPEVDLVADPSALTQYDLEPPVVEEVENLEVIEEATNVEGEVYTNEVFETLRVPYPAGWTVESRREASGTYPGLDDVIVEMRGNGGELDIRLSPTEFCGCGCGDGPLPEDYEVRALNGSVREFLRGEEVIYAEQVECAIGYFAQSNLPVETSGEFASRIEDLRPILTEEEQASVWFDARIRGRYSSGENLADIRGIIRGIER